MTILSAFFSFFFVSNKSDQLFFVVVTIKNDS